MIAVPLMERGEQVVCHADWPLFYMNDFSKMGLVVSQMGPVLTLLQAKGFAVLEPEAGRPGSIGALQIGLDDRHSLQDLTELLANQGLDYEFTDLIRCVYQG